MKTILILLSDVCISCGQVLAVDKPNIFVKAQAKWESLGKQTIDLQIASGPAHRFFNQEPWGTGALIAVDE